jgi:hypothetical protein
MAVMPGAVFLNAASSKPMTRYDIVCIHTIVGYAPAHAAHFSTKANGYIYQSRDTMYKGAANYEGNHRIISIENEDHGPAFGAWDTDNGHQVPAFTDAQVEAIAKICAWAYHTHGIPLVLAPNSKPGSRGIAYHRQGVDGNWAGYAFGGRVYGGELWTLADGKVCPGDRRISQLINRIIPRARVLAGLDVPPPPPERKKEDMSLRLVKGNSTQMVPGKTYSYGALQFMVRLDPTLPEKAERWYLEGSPAQRGMLKSQGSLDVWEQDDLDAIPFAPGGEIPPGVLD